MRNVIRKVASFLWHLVVVASEFFVGLKMILFYSNKIIDWLFNEPGVIAVARSWVRSAQRAFMAIDLLWVKVMVVLFAAFIIAGAATAIKTARKRHAFERFNSFVKRLASVAIVLWATWELLNEDLGWSISVRAWMSNITTTGVVIAILSVLLFVAVILLVRTSKKKHKDE